MAVDMKKTKSMQKIQSISEKGVSEANNKLIKEIPLDLIDPHPMNSVIYTTEGIDGLCHSIESSGFFGAIDVYQKEDGRYMISSGHRRYLAMKKLGKKTIPALISKMEPDDVVLRKLIEANQNTRTPSPMEKAMEIVSYEDALRDGGYKGKVDKKLCEVFNMSTGKLYKIKSIAKLTEELKKYAYNLTFPYEAFSEAVHFSKEQQIKLASMIESHFRLYPDAELSNILAKQFIEQIKTEAKIEKERKEREKYLKQAREMIKEESTLEIPIETPVETPKKFSVDIPTQALEQSMTISPETDFDINGENNISEIPLDNLIDFSQQEYSFPIPMPPLQPTESENSIVSEAQLPIQELDEENSELVNIDFDLTMYTKRMLEKLEDRTTVISKDIKEELIFSINRIVDLLNKK